MITDKYRIGKTFISITNPIDAQERIKASVEAGGGTYVCVSDPRTVDLASKDPKYREVMANSLMNTPDGQPTLWAARLWGLKNVERTMGPILFQDMITNPSSGLKHYLLGDTDETLDTGKGICFDRGGHTECASYGRSAAELRVDRKTQPEIAGNE